MDSWAEAEWLARFRSLVANSSDVTLVYGPDGVISYVSPSIERVMGYEPSAQVGRSHGCDLRRLPIATGVA